MTKEKRLIDANTLPSYILEFNDVNHEERQRMHIVLAQDIDNAPTVDAVPVVHGQWISLTECANAGVYCSVCHKKVWKEDYAWCNRKNKLRSNYCPHCGSKMDGDAQP